VDLDQAPGAAGDAFGGGVVVIDAREFRTPRQARALAMRIAHDPAGYLAVQRAARCRVHDCRQLIAAGARSARAPS
jgi:hypothetical protein